MGTAARLCRAADEAADGRRAAVASADRRAASGGGGAGAAASAGEREQLVGSGSCGSGSLAGDVHASLVSVSRAQYERELDALQREHSQFHARLVRALAAAGGGGARRSRSTSQELQRAAYNRLRDLMSANLSLHEVRVRSFVRNCTQVSFAVFDADRVVCVVLR